MASVLVVVFRLMAPFTTSAAKYFLQISALRRDMVRFTTLPGSVSIGLVCHRVALSCGLSLPWRSSGESVGCVVSSAAVG